MRLPLVGLKLSTGTLALGVLAFVYGPKVLSKAGGFVRPVAKTGIKGGMMAYDKCKEVFVDAVDAVQDVATEARDELSKGHKAAPKKKAKKA